MFSLARRKLMTGISIFRSRNLIGLGIEIWTKLRPGRSDWPWRDRRWLGK